MLQTALFDYTIFFQNKDEFNKLKREIFTNHCYYCEFDNDTPLIIDAGAHIGLTTLYFKHLYPESQILSIEPHPLNFKFLQKNCLENRVSNVELRNLALTNNSSSHVTLFADQEQDWLMSSSVFAGAWNGFQEGMIPISVPSARLSELIIEKLRPHQRNKIDLLKLDVEGSEWDLIADLSKNNLLAKIERIIVEVHAKKGQDLANFVDNLEKKGFHLGEELSRKIIQTKEPVLQILSFTQ